MEIEDLNTFICNLKENLADTYCTLTKLDDTLENYANKIHKHVIADVEGLQAALNNKASKDEATQSISGLMSKNDKKKLDGIADGATKYTHPTQTAQTGKPTTNIEPKFGDTVSVSQVITNNTGHVTNLNTRNITIPNTLVSTSKEGLMSTTDKNKLDHIATNANNYIHPLPSNSFFALNKGLYKIEVNETGHISSASSVVKKDITDLGIPAQDTTYTHPKPTTNFSAHTIGLYKIGIDATGHINNVNNITKKDITDLGIPAQDTTYNPVTVSTPGLMTPDDKKRLDRQSTYQLFLTSTPTINPPTSNELSVSLATSNPSIYAMVLLDGAPIESGTINFIINGVTYDKNINESGLAGKSISLDPGDYLIIAQYRKNGWTVASDIKTLKVTR